jgi:hypothetical protein
MKNNDLFACIECMRSRKTKSKCKNNYCLLNWILSQIKNCKMNEWLLFNANSAIFSSISMREHVNFQLDDDDVRFVLDQHA